MDVIVKEIVKCVGEDNTTDALYLFFKDDELSESLVWILYDQYSTLNMVRFLIRVCRRFSWLSSIIMKSLCGDVRNVRYAREFIHEFPLCMDLRSGIDYHYLTLIRDRVTDDELAVYALYIKSEDLRRQFFQQYIVLTEAKVIEMYRYVYDRRDQLFFLMTLFPRVNTLLAGGWQDLDIIRASLNWGLVPSSTLYKRLFREDNLEFFKELCIFHLDYIRHNSRRNIREYVIFTFGIHKRCSRCQKQYRKALKWRGLKKNFMNWFGLTPHIIKLIFS